MFENGYKDYFIKHDGLNNVQNEVIFSLLKRYSCFAGCKVCYTQKDFERALPEFNKFVPNKIDPEMEKQWFEVFDYFYCVSNIDDIFWMKHNQPHLYAWYLEHGNMFQWGNMTDNNFIRSQPLFVNEFDSTTKIYEISFSSKWLEQVDLDDIIQKLDILNKRNGVNKIKFIFDSSDDYQLSNVKRLFDWTYEQGINEHNCSHHNFLGKQKTLQSGKTIPEQAEFLVSSDGVLYNILKESDYLQYDGFFLTLQQSIDVNTKPYYTFTSFDYHAHLYSMMQGKIKVYNDWSTKYNNGLINHNEGLDKHFAYFEWVSKNVKVNANYNYIPIDIMRPNSRYYNKLTEKNWQATELGLIKKDTTNVVPLMEIVNG
jgi:hypothetical protein